MFFLQIFLLSSSLSLCPSTFFSLCSTTAHSLSQLRHRAKEHTTSSSSLHLQPSQKRSSTQISTYISWISYSLHLCFIGWLFGYIHGEERKKKKNEVKKEKEEKNLKLVRGTAESRARSESERKRSVCIRMCTVAEEQQAAASQPQPASTRQHLGTLLEKRENKVFEKNGWCWCLSSETHSKKKSKHEQRRRKKILRSQSLK